MTTFVSPGASGRDRRTADDGAAPRPLELVRIFFRQMLPYLALWFVVLASVGWLLGHPLKDAVSGEDAVNRWFASVRTPGWNTATNIMSLVANTGTIIITMLAATLVYWLIARRLRDVLPVVLGVMTQAGLFLLTTLLIDRPRPEVPKLDESPPTSSFPSGHTGAATALYVGLAILCIRRFPSLAARVFFAVLFGLVPLGVATSRLYRGMHHPSDVVFGLLNGVVCAVIAYMALRPPRP